MLQFSKIINMAGYHYYMRKKNTLVTVVISLLLITACTSSPRYITRDSFEKIIVKNNEDFSSYSDYPVLETETGIASFYADKFNGKITYSGEVYDMYGISAAHTSYPMNTIVRVTNLDNNKKVILRINDKMPPHDDRIIDLSLGAAQTLDFVNNGLAKVKVEVLKWGE